MSILRDWKFDTFHESFLGEFYKLNSPSFLPDISQENFITLATGSDWDQLSYELSGSSYFRIFNTFGNWGEFAPFYKNTFEYSLIIEETLAEKYFTPKTLDVLKRQGYKFYSNPLHKKNYYEFARVPGIVKMPEFVENVYSDFLYTIQNETPFVLPTHAFTLGFYMKYHDFMKVLNKHYTDIKSDNLNGTNNKT